MTRHPPSTPPPAPGFAHGWLHALAAVLAGYAVMVVVAALGLWLAGASELPQGAFLPVIAATVVMAVGGRVGLEGGAGTIARSDAAVTVFPLSVALAGALVTAYVVVRPLRRHAVVPGRRMLWLFVRTAVLWALATLLIALGARHTFTISTGEEFLNDLGDLLGLTPTVGFRADVPVSVVAGLLWLAVVLVLAFAVSRRAPLPSRLVPAHTVVRPAARAMVGVLLAYVVVGGVIAVVTAFTRAEPADGFAVVFLGLPNVAWIALGIGMGASWHGNVQGHSACRCRRRWPPCCAAGTGTSHSISRRCPSRTEWRGGWWSPSPSPCWAPAGPPPGARRPARGTCATPSTWRWRPRWPCC